MNILDVVADNSSELISINEKLADLVRVITSNNAILSTLISLLGIIAVCEIIRVGMSIYSKIKNRNKRS